MSSSLRGACASALVWGASAALVPWICPALANAAPGTLQIRIDAPQPGEVVKNSVHLALLRGRAQSGSEAPAHFDLLVAIDVSHSTRYPHSPRGEVRLALIPNSRITKRCSRTLNSAVLMTAVPFWRQPFEARRVPVVLFHAG